MQKVLYKTASPKSFDDGEYYQINADFRFLGGQRNVVVTEKHGYWSDEEKRVVNVTVTLSPEEGYGNMLEALARFQQQVNERVRNGFFYSWEIDPTTPPFEFCHDLRNSTVVREGPNV